VGNSPPNAPGQGSHARTVNIRTALNALRTPVATTRASLSKGLCTDDAERQAHVESIRAVVCDPELEKVHEWIHTNLIILDSKAQSILGLNSIALATLTIYYVALGPATPKLIVIAVLLGFVVIAWSIIPLARVAFVYWSTTEEFQHPDRLFVDLIRVRDARTEIIRLSTLKGGVFLVLFGVVVAWDIWHRFGF
jgi:hypothetical protein